MCENGVITISKNELWERKKPRQNITRKPKLFCAGHFGLICIRTSNESNRARFSNRNAIHTEFFSRVLTKTHNIVNLNKMTIKIEFIGILIQTQIFSRFKFFVLNNKHLTISRGLIIDTSLLRNQFRNTLLRYPFNLITSASSSSMFIFVYFYCSNPINSHPSLEILQVLIKIWKKNVVGSQLVVICRF